ncbi:hypothetical protein OG361_38415 [Streptomyces sp. NBC_00090]|uniref:hypothetical protein n=1 Tax=Streptomyces sp. NBC_00090 TaxID=2903619 RepID=UPI00324943F5
MAVRQVAHVQVAPDRAVESLLHFSPEVGQAVDDALESAPTSPVAQSFAAYLGALGTEPGDALAARRRFDRYAAGVAPCTPWRRETPAPP